MDPLKKVTKEGKLSLGLVFPLESYQGSVPLMQNQEELARLAENYGFKSLWFRDVPFHDPSFGDAGQMYDPWVYMAHMMNQTEKILLATGSVILPLRHPVHTLKSINSLQILSKGRIMVGIASGDRPLEYPAFNMDINSKNELFRESFEYLKALDRDFPNFSSDTFGKVSGNIDLLPKSNYKTNYFVTGHAGQSLDWIAQNADGWLYYPRNSYFLENLMNDWKLSLTLAGYSWKPFMQSLYIDLVNKVNVERQAIHLGFRSNPEYLLKYLKEIQSVGVNHVILNLKFNQAPIGETIKLIGDQIISRM